MCANGNVVLIEPSRRRHVRQRGRDHRRTCGKGSSQRSACCSRTIRGSRPTGPRAPRAATDRARPGGLLALPAVRGGKGRPLWQIKARRVVLREGGADGDLPRRAAGDVRPADRPTRPGSATPHPGVKRASRASSRPTFGSTSELGLFAQIPYYYRARPELATSPSRRSSPRTAAPCSPASTGACTATATPSSPAAAPTPTPCDESDGRASRARSSAATSEASAATASATTRQAGYDLFLSSRQHLPRPLPDRRRSSVLRNRVLSRGLRRTATSGR